MLRSLPPAITIGAVLQHRTLGIFLYNKVKSKRFNPLLEAFGADRLMMGSNFPFVIETEGRYTGAVNTVKSWIPEGGDLNAVMGGTAERLFGSWRP